MSFPFPHPNFFWPKQSAWQTGSPHPIQGKRGRPATGAPCNLSSPTFRRFLDSKSLLWIGPAFSSGKWNSALLKSDGTQHRFDFLMFHTKGFQRTWNLIRFLLPSPWKGGVAWTRQANHTYRHHNDGDWHEADNWLWLIDWLIDWLVEWLIDWLNWLLVVGDLHLATDWFWLIDFRLLVIDTLPNDLWQIDEFEKVQAQNQTTPFSSIAWFQGPHSDQRGKCHARQIHATAGAGKRASSHPDGSETAGPEEDQSAEFAQANIHSQLTRT